MINNDISEVIYQINSSIDFQRDGLFGGRRTTSDSLGTSLKTVAMV